MGGTESVGEVDSLDVEEEEGGEVLAALFLSLCTGVLAHLVLPILPTLLISYVIGYRCLMKNNKRLFNFNYLIILIFSISILRPVFFEYQTYILDTLLACSLGLMGVKATRKFLGISLRRFTINFQREAAVSAIQSKSIIGVLTSVFNFQNLWILGIIGIAVFPLMLLDIMSAVIGFGSFRIILVSGIISIGTIAIILDIKDRAIIAAGSVRDTFTSDKVEGGQDRQEAVALLNDIDEELPNLEDVRWTREDIQQLSADQFFEICGNCAEAECKKENLEYTKFESSKGFGYLYRIVFPEEGLTLAQISCYRNPGDEQSLNDIIQNVEYLIEKKDMNPHLVGLDVNIDIDQSTRIDYLKEDGIILGGIDELRRDFHDKDLHRSEVFS